MQAETPKLLKPLAPMAQGILESIVGIDREEMIRAARYDSRRAGLTCRSKPKPKAKA